MSSIVHRFVSAIADEADATLIRPSNWNDGHDLTLAATQRAIGRNTAGAGAAEEVTASQIFDWISATNGAFLWRSGGTWQASTNITVDNDNLTIAETFSPSAPAAGKVKIHGVVSAGRPMLSAIGPTGTRMPLQPLTGTRMQFSVLPRNDGANVLTVTGTRADLTGTLTARLLATTNAYTAARKCGIVSAAGAGSVANEHAAANVFVRGNAANMGGFYLCQRFGISDASLVATANMFVGVSNTSSALADVGPETLTNLIGIGCTSGDTTLQLYAAGASAQSRTSLGANFPCNTISTDIYEVVLFAPANASSVMWECTRLLTGDRATGTISAGANLPSATAFLTWQMQRSNGGTASAVGIDLFGVYGESDI